VRDAPRLSRLFSHRLCSRVTCRRARGGETRQPVRRSLTVTAPRWSGLATDPDYPASRSRGSFGALWRLDLALPVWERRDGIHMVA
jgi:hypothetical protein